MGKLDRSGAIVKPAPPVGKIRRFPWRLWLWAIVMTGVAGAGGYFTWVFKGKADDATSSEGDAVKKASEKEAALADKDKALTAKTAEAATCATDRAKLDKENKTFAEQLTTNQGQLTELAKVVEQNKAQLEAANDFKNQFSKMIDSGAIKVAQRHGNLVLSLPAEVLFPSGVAELSDDGKVKVHEIGFTLKDKGPKNARYLVVGHSDNQPLKNSTYKDNWELSTARALTVTHELVLAGMAANRLLPAGAGEHDPLGPNTSVKDLAKNRRIEIQLLPAIAEIEQGEKKPDDKKPDDKKPDDKKPEKK